MLVKAGHVGIRGLFSFAKVCNLENKRRICVEAGCCCYCVFCTSWNGTSAPTLEDIGVLHGTMDKSRNVPPDYCTQLATVSRCCCILSCLRCPQASSLQLRSALLFFLFGVFLGKQEGFPPGLSYSSMMVPIRGSTLSVSIIFSYFLSYFITGI